MSTILIVMVLLAIAGGVVFLAVRKKPVAKEQPILPQDADTGWNDPIDPEPSQEPKAEPRP